MKPARRAEVGVSLEGNWFSLRVSYWLGKKYYVVRNHEALAAVVGLRGKDLVGSTNLRSDYWDSGDNIMGC